MKTMRTTIKDVFFLVSVVVTFFTAVTVTFAQSQYDLDIKSVKVIQVVEDPRLLVANKPAAIKVSIMSDFPYPVTVPIEVKYNFEKSTYVELGPDGSGVTLNPGNNTFYIPGGPQHLSEDEPWIDGPPYLYWHFLGRDVNIEVTVDPDHTVDEFNISNNIEIIEKEVMMPIDFRVLVVPVVLGADEDFIVPADAVERQRALMLKTYPLASLTFTQQPQVRRDDVVRWNKNTAYNDFVFAVSNRAKLLGYNRVAIVLNDASFPYGGLAIQMLSAPEDRIPVVLKDFDVENVDSLTAHEIGHTYYLWHPHSNWFDDLPALQDYKYSVTERDYGYLYNTLMSYEAAPHWNDRNRYCDYPKTWFVTPSRYDYTVTGTWQWNLQDQLLQRYNIPVWLIKARLSKAGVLDIFPWYRMLGIPDLTPIINVTANDAQVSAAAVQNPDGQRSLQIVLLDANQQQLAVFPFNVSFSNLIEPDPQGELIVVEPDAVPFHFNIPVMANTALIQIVDEDGTVFGKRAVTANAPVVELQNPNGGESITVGSEYSICWSGTDQDGDTLQYFLAVSPDNGDNWLPIASDETGPCLVWDTSNYTPGSNYLVKVIATDGVNTDEDVSDSTFSLVMPDDDGDGVPNDNDNCPNTCNFNQLDADSDGIGDVCDQNDGCFSCGNGPICEIVCDPGADTDNDGILDGEDNCINNCNTQQLDADDDGIGDVCDTEDDGCDGCGDNGPICEQEC
jgi:hypothetical protein